MSNDERTQSGSLCQVSVMTRMQSILILICLAVAASSYSVNAGEATSRLEIILPGSFRTPDGYKHREARFGRPSYGGSILANVYYTDFHMCLDEQDINRGGYPTRDVDETGQMARWEPPFILMMNRSECSFVEQVRNAQHAGASAAIIADTKCLCSAARATCWSEKPWNCQSKAPIMADNGSGSDVTIPSFLMQKQDADPIKNSIKFNDTVVYIKMTWSTPRPDSIVEYSLWTTPNNIVSRPLLQSFGEVAKALGTHATFVPHMYIVDGEWLGCSGSWGENNDQCSNLCTNKGKYCASAPDFSNGIYGVDIVEESLRRLCIWEEYGKDGIGITWWNYVKHFIERCGQEKYFFGDACVREAMIDAGVDYDTVKNCMTDSGGLEDGENSMLEKELASRDETGSVIIPSIFVNDAPLRGAVNTIEVFQAICAGFAEGSTEPEICRFCVHCPHVTECVDTGVCDGIPYNPAAKRSAGDSSRTDTLSTHTFAFWMFFVVCTFGGVGYWHYKRTRADVHEQAREILAEYMPLGDQDGGNPVDCGGAK